jgi:methanogenic corrinoid protein MtbC1
MEIKGLSSFCPDLRASAGLRAEADALTSRRSSSASGDPGRRRQLALVIRDQIVPRLVAIHHDIHRTEMLESVSPEEIDHFGQLVMASDPQAATVFFERMRERGHSLDTLYEGLMAPTARHLGELWHQDRCDFIDVTLGVSRLQELLKIFSSAADITIVDIRRRALLIATPGDHHLFGLDLIGTFLREAAWDVMMEKGLGVEQNIRTVAGEWFGVAGVAMSAVSMLDAVARTIEALRRASLNPAIAVIVGGRAFNEHPELVARVGADAAANDGPTAAIVAKRLLIQQAAAA